MHVLIVKTSSMGDVIHTLPAVTDAVVAVPDIRFDWVVEETLAELPSWHAAVDRVIPVALRRWRRQPLKSLVSGEWSRFRAMLKDRAYSKVIDAQGLMKSALLTRMARGPRCGLARDSAREPAVALAYGERYSIKKGQHAIVRVRQLFAACLDYAAPSGTPDYGIDKQRFQKKAPRESYLVFLHGTTWPTKLWPEVYWAEVARLAGADGLTVYLPWGSEADKVRAQRIAAPNANVKLLDRLDLAGVAAVLSGARGVVAVDTGLGHLAAALGIPCVTLYGATQPGLTGTLGRDQKHMRAQFECSPCLNRKCTYQGPSKVKPACYATLSPTQVWDSVLTIMGRPQAV